MSSGSSSSMEPTVASSGAHPSPAGASSAAGSTGDQQGGGSRTKKKRSHPDASSRAQCAAAADGTSSRPTHEATSSNGGNSNSGKEDAASATTVAAAAVVQTPHTLRLLRLAVSGTADHSCRARTLLSDLARRSSPDLLWDLLGRLVVGSSSSSSGSNSRADIRSGLYSSKWSERENAAATMGTIAANLPGVDRRGFLSDPHEDDDDIGGGVGASNGLWLQVDDLLGSAESSGNDEGHNIMESSNGTIADNNKLDTILEEGRLLLSSSGDAYSKRNDDEEEEERALRDLDESAVSAGTDPGKKKLESFLKRRVRLQRQILAKRLGLGGILLAPVMTNGTDEQAQNNLLEDMVDDSDLLSSKSQDESFRDADGKVDAAALARRKNMERRGRKRRRRSTDNESGERKDEESGVNLRALLVLEMRRSGGSEKGAENVSSSAQSHRNPQTLLATDLLYRTFDADWTVRHGALMAILALMKSWIVSLGGERVISESDRSQCFGSWPHDILTRCLCILSLDRFGDYSGSTLDKATGTGGDRVVAPVRETAAQLLALLLSIAPSSVQASCCLVLTRLVKHEGDWEVRHGAMLAFKYIVTLRTRMSTSPSSVSASDLLVCPCWNDVCSLAVIGLSDRSDDVRGASAQVLTCYFGNGEDKNKDTASDLGVIVEECAAPLWSALLQVASVSSCAIDILALFALVMQYNCNLVLHTVPFRTANDGAATQGTFEAAIQKMVEFLRSDDEAVKTSSLLVVGAVMKPMILRSVSQAESEGEGSLSSVTRAYCDLLANMFSSYFELDAADEDDTIKEGEIATMSARDDAWVKAIDAISPLLSHKTCRIELFQMLSSAILRFAGIDKRKNGDPPRRVVGSLDTLDERCAASFECQINAARALGLLAMEFGLVSSKEEDVPTPGVLFLIDLLQSLTKSPWPSICESACILYAAMGEISLGRSTPINSVMLQSRQLFTSMLMDGPQCLSLAGEASMVLRDPSVISACDQILISMVNDHTSALAKLHPSAVSEEGGHQISANEVIQIWQGIFRAKGMTLQSDGKNVKSAVTTVSMRLSSSIAGAAISWGLRDLPIKLTPIIRPLMTSLKNDESPKRLDWTCRYLARLLTLRPPKDTLPVPINVRDKVLTNVCSVALSDASGDSSSSACAAAGKNILRSIARDFDGNIDCIAPFSLIFTPLKEDNIGSQAESSGVSVALQRGLGLLSLLSQSLQSESQAYGQIVNEMLQVVVRLACTHTSSRIQRQSINIICTMCKSDLSKALQKVIPVLLEYLKGIGNERIRLHSCRLLQEILNAVGTMICPFVRCLLPIAMSLMTDPNEECASLAASSFAALVRVSPLVQKRRDAKPDDADSSETEHSSDKVIDHLIHGEPLPPLRLPRQIQACLDNSCTSLRGYQQEGVSWLHFLQSVNLNGALCDDMGVGKSLQALIGIALAHAKSAAASVDGVKSLVVCPSTVTGHWMNEVKKYFPDKQMFKPLMYTGPAKSRKAMLQEQLKECNLVVTSYSVLRNDVDALSALSWVYCVLDEGHLLKNPRSATAKASRRIKSQHKLILSGTPVQNHVNELWAVFDFLMPSFLGTEASFTKSFAKPIINGQVSGASPTAIGTSMNKLKLLHQTVLPFILRREKQDVMKELPPKVISDIPCVLSSEQASLYQQFIESSEAKHALTALQKSMQEAYKERNGTNDGDTNMNQEQFLGKDVLKSLLYLRRLCTHPMLVMKLGSDDAGSEAEEISEQLSRLECSGKLLALKDLLQSASICSDGLTAADNDQSTLYARRITADRDDLSSGDISEGFGDGLDPEEGGTLPNERDQSESKCLIFAQFAQSLDVVEEYLFTPHMPSLRYLRIDGQVPPEERTKRVDRFNSDESIQLMLLTTRVGGLGLNLTGADTVIFLESDWNPFSDLQAMDRAHRIGQTKTVNVYRLICSDTIEEKIMRLQSIKMEMSRAIVNSDNSTMCSMGTDRLLDLFTFEDRQQDDSDRKTGSGNGVEGSTGAKLLDAISSQEDEYVSLSTESFLRDLLPGGQTESNG